MSARTIVVTGATGLQGGAVARALLDRGWRVRALTRRPQSRAAAALAALGVELHRGDMADTVSLRSAFAGAHGVYSVQNPFISGVAGEVVQGRTVAEAAAHEHIEHVVYGSAGLGLPGTGVPSWESKLRIEAHMKQLDLPLTILRPMAFMEIMTERKFYPALSTWHVMPALMGETRPVAWLSVPDLGVIAATAFERPTDFIGRDLRLAADLQSIERCRTIFREVTGRPPPRLRVPVWLFERMGFVGTDLTRMWRWLRTAQFDVDLGATRSIQPSALDVRAWLVSRQQPATPQVDQRAGG